jgi:glucose-6-phosphate isomerase
LVNINAYHQPGVEAGKKAAGAVIALQLKILEYLNSTGGASATSPKIPHQKGFTVSQIAVDVGSRDFETIFKICEHLSANSARKMQKTDGKTPFDATYRLL